MKKHVVTLAITFMVCIMATPAHATLQVIINGNAGATVTKGTGIEVTDGCTAVTPTCDISDTSGATGTVNFTYGLVSFNISTFGATSGSPLADLSMTLTGGPLMASTLDFTIAISDNGYSNPGPPLFIDQTVSGNAALNGVTGTLTAQGYFGANATAFDLSGPTTGLASTTIGAAQGMAASPTILNGNPYSLTTFITVHLVKGTNLTNENAQVNADLSAVQVPEPAGVALLGGILFLTAGSLRRRLRRV
jgi:hypothetical protein